MIALPSSPKMEISKGKLINAPITLLFKEAGLVPSRCMNSIFYYFFIQISFFSAFAAEAKRMIIQGGLYLNDEKISDTELNVSESDLIHNQALFLRAGKSKYCIVCVK
jgi:hypothetical protein